MDVKQLFKSAVSLLTLNVLSKLVLLLNGVFISRYGGVDVLGFYAIYMALSKFLETLSKYGCGTFILKVSKDGNLNHFKTLLSIFILTSTLSVFFYLILVGLKYFFFPSLYDEVTQHLVLIFITFFLSVHLFIFCSYIQGKKSAFFALLIKEFLPAVLLLCCIVISTNVTILDVMIFNAVIFAVCLLLAGIVIWFILENDLTNQKYLNINSLWITCRPFYISAIVQYVFIWSDSLILGAFITAAELGQYRAAAQLSSIGLVVIGAFNAYFNPIIVRLYNDKQIDLISMNYVRVVRWMMYAIIPAFALLLVHWELFISIYKIVPTESIKFVLTILVIAQSVNVFFGSSGYTLALTGQEEKLKNNSIISLFFGLVVMTSLSYLFGSHGMSIAILVLVIFSNLLNVFSLSKAGISTFNASYFKILFPLTFCVLIILFFETSSLIFIALKLLICYLFLLIWFVRNELSA